ncbi:MAG: ATP-binding protein, partial [Xanthomonadales bacterium]|nr:ATP-binding protein [Xanthomonadales bacterium]
VRALWPAGTGGMWIGAWGGGVTRIDPDGSTLSYSVASGHLIDNQVRAMLEDSRGDLWIGTERRGITHIAGEDVTHYTVDNSVLLSSDIRSIAEAPDGSIWFGTYGRGLVRYRDNVLERFDLMERGIIFSIAFEPDGSAWVGTEDSLFRLTGESAMRVPIEPKVAVFHALDDGMGRLWLCTNFGILAIDRESALAATGSIDAELFDADHGLRSRQCNGASQPAGWKSDEGVLWFPTADGVTRVDPGDMPKNERAPPVVVEEVIVDGRSMRIGGGTLEIAPGSRLIEIDYAALTFIAPTKVRYQYRLFGQDRDWVEAGSRRHAFYNNLPPGSYEFQVRAANADGVWNRDGAALKLRQLPEVHQTWWFRAGATAFIVALILATWRWRSADLRRQNVHLESTVAKRTEELEKTNSELEGTLLKLTTTQAQLVEAEKMAALGALVAGVAHEINTPVGNGITIASHLKDRIEQIRASVPPDMSGRIAPVEDGLGMIEANLQRTRKIVTSFKRAAVDKDRAQRRTFQLSRVLNRERLLFAHPIEAGGHSLKVELEDDPQLDSYPDPLFDTLGNLIQNSLVHGFEQDQQGTIRIVASLRGERLELIVEDDGRGIPLENRKTVFDPFVTRHRGRHAGLGLHIVYNTVTWLLGGDVECLEKERGARFRIIIPLSAPE